MLPKFQSVDDLLYKDFISIPFDWMNPAGAVLAQVCETRELTKRLSPVK
jgi:hypothetical protein